MNLSELKPENLIEELTERGNLWQLRAQALAVELKRLGQAGKAERIIQETDKQKMLDEMNMQ